jgi:tRNA nucleotidyltransferase (CCA-adding enzyme)
MAGMLARLVSPDRTREDGHVTPPEPDRLPDPRQPGQLLSRVRALPAAQPLLSAVEGAPGVHLVGGAVRDLLLGGQPFDLDLVVEDDPVAVARRIGGPVTVHDRFGTSTVTAGGFVYDIARARRETYAHPGALPDVSPAELEEDLRRRDFTVNAIAMALGGPTPGSLTAAANALDDLEARRLHVLHDASFIDDPTRLLRLARYRGRLGFEIEPSTRALAREAIEGAALETISGTRLGNELRLLSREDDPVAALVALTDLELDRSLHPSFGLTDPELARRALSLLPPDGRRERLVLAVAAREVPDDELTALLDRLAFPAADRDAIVAAVREAPQLSRGLAAAGRPSEIAAGAAGAGVEAVALAGAIGAEAQARQWIEELRHIRPTIDGHDLMAAGAEPGPALGRALSAALAARLDGRAVTRDDELTIALQALERED